MRCDLVVEHPRIHEPKRGSILPTNSLTGTKVPKGSAMKTRRAMLPQAEDALAVFASLVAQGRRRRGWTAEELAERVGVSPKTLRKVEHGDPTVALGIALEAAALVGVPLVADPDDLPSVRAREQDRLALLPRRVRAHVSEIELNDDF